MIVLDANLLIYAYDRQASQHVAAKSWLESTFTREPSIGLPLQSIAAFLRLMTERKFHKEPFFVEDAIDVVDSWLARSNIHLLLPGNDHWPTLAKLLTRYRIQGRLISDAQIVAIVLANGGRLASADRDFRRFSEIACNNPLDNPA